MKNTNRSICLLLGKGDRNTKEIGQALALEGITAIVKQKNPADLTSADERNHWSGQPGQDLFFNGWKLLF